MTEVLGVSIGTNELTCYISSIDVGGWLTTDFSFEDPLRRVRLHIGSQSSLRPTRTAAWLSALDMFGKDGIRDAIGSCDGLYRAKETTITTLGSFFNGLLKAIPI